MMSFKKKKKKRNKNNNNQTFSTTRFVQFSKTRKFPFFVSAQCKNKMKQFKSYRKNVYTHLSLNETKLRKREKCYVDNSKKF